MPIFRANRTKETLIMIGDLTPAEVARVDQDIAKTRALIDRLVAEAGMVRAYPLDGRGELIHAIADIGEMAYALNGDHKGTYALCVELVLCLAEARGVIR
jgi:hypothetical protein